MNITRISPLTGKIYTMDLPVTAEQMWRFSRREEREFILTGITPVEWTQLVSEPE